MSNFLQTVFYSILESIVMLSLLLLVLHILDVVNGEMPAHFNDTRLRCIMTKSCQEMDTCELPCKIISDIFKVVVFH